METPAVIGHRLKHGQPVPIEVLERIAGEDVPAEPSPALSHQQSGPITLPPELDEKLAEAKRTSAAAVEARFSAAKQFQQRRLNEGSSGLDTSSGRQQKDEKELSDFKAAAARELQRSRQAFEEYASEVAKRVLADVFDDRLTRIQAMKIYNRITEERGLPRSIRIGVRKQFFGK